MWLVTNFQWYNVQEIWLVIPKSGLVLNEMKHGMKILRHFSMIFSLGYGPNRWCCSPPEAFLCFCFSQFISDFFLKKSICVIVKELLKLYKTMVSLNFLSFFLIPASFIDFLATQGQRCPHSFMNQLLVFFSPQRRWFSIFVHLYSRNIFEFLIIPFHK